MKFQQATNNQAPRNTTAPRPLSQAEIDQVSGGVALLLPAVQKVREAARRG